jgi:hypothetical protein
MAGGPSASISSRLPNRLLRRYCSSTGRTRSRHPPWWGVGASLQAQSFADLMVEAWSFGGAIAGGPDLPDHDGSEFFTVDPDGIAESARPGAQRCQTVPEALRPWWACAAERASRHGRPLSEVQGHGRPRGRDGEAGELAWRTTTIWRSA